MLGYHQRRSEPDHRLGVEGPVNHYAARERGGDKAMREIGVAEFDSREQSYPPHCRDLGRRQRLELLAQVCAGLSSPLREPLRDDYLERREASRA